MTGRLTRTLGAMIAGIFCLTALSGVLVVHAWPLWTGQAVLLPVIPIDPRDIFRGEYVRLATSASRVAIRTRPGAGSRRNTAPPPAGAIAVDADASWAGLATGTAVAGATIYVQLEPSGDAGESRPVSISSTLQPGRVNLRGRVTRYEDAGQTMTIDYGLDRYFMEEGSAKRVEAAIRDRRRVQMEIAVAASGRARIRRLRVEGVPQ
jgi:uncharacterized membrane-anchored protein